MRELEPVKPENVLAVVAHPDDDILGFGGTAFRLAKRGHRVRAAILCGDVTARAHRPPDDDLVADMRRATALVGMDEPILGDFPNIRMNTVDHLDLVQFVEAAIVETQATRIFTLHPADLNDDHRQVSQAAQAAARLAQRRADVPALQSLHFMEVLSSTDWSFRGSGVDGFAPDAFFEVGEEGVDIKLEALKCYRDVMRPYPHPRSPEAVRGLAALRGGQSGVEHAEAFQTAFLNLDFLTR